MCTIFLRKNVEKIAIILESFTTFQNLCCNILLINVGFGGCVVDEINQCCVPLLHKTIINVQLLAVIKSRVLPVGLSVCMHGLVF